MPDRPGAQGSELDPLIAEVVERAGRRHVGLGVGGGGDVEPEDPIVSGTAPARERAVTPDLDPDFKVNFVISKNDGELSVASQDVEAVPDDLERWIQEDAELGVVGRLLE
jgi:hypothetical protein